MFWPRLPWKFSFVFYVFIKSSNFWKQSFFWLKFTLSFKKHVLNQTSKAFNTKFGPQWKDCKSNYQVKQTLSLLCIFVTVILDENYVKGLSVTKIVKQIKFEGDWGKLEAKYFFQRQSWAKYMRQTLVLVWNSTLWEKFNFNFWTVFC